MVHRAIERKACPRHPASGGSRHALESGHRLAEGERGRSSSCSVRHVTADVVGKTTLGIYKIEDDQATFFVRRPGETNRPTEFKDIEDETFMFVIKKVK